MDPFLTVYKRDYVAKPYKPTPPFTAVSEFRDPLSESFRTFLYLSGDATKPQPVYPDEDADEYLEKLKKTYSYLASTYYKNPIDKSILERNFLLNDKTVYQIDYCNLDEETRSKKEKERNKFSLPDDWDIPVTTQKSSYRDPKSLNASATKPPPPVRPRHNLGFDEKLRKILKVTTGRTEYQGRIGELGDIIIEDAMHGKIVHLQCPQHGRR